MQHHSFSPISVYTEGVLTARICKALSKRSPRFRASAKGIVKVAISTLISELMSHSILRPIAPQPHCFLSPYLHLVSLSLPTFLMPACPAPPPICFLLPPASFIVPSSCLLPSFMSPHRHRHSLGSSWQLPCMLLFMPHVSLMSCFPLLLCPALLPNSLVCQAGLQHRSLAA